MVKPTQAYITTTGVLFQTREEANMEEIRDAAGVVAGVELDNLIGICAGRINSAGVRNAVLRLAQAINPPPEPKDK